MLVFSDAPIDDYRRLARSHRLRADRAEERAADLEEAIRDALEHFEHCRLVRARLSLENALACPLCGARAERECSGLDEAPRC